jgi:pyruvate formate lyase activating enzyme
MTDDAVSVPLLLSPPMEVADDELAQSEEIRDNSTGSVHSWDLVTGADGPGTRMTLFMAGCGLRCQFCHNPDTWRMKDGVRHTVDEVMERVTRYATVMKVTDGGLTISGGEPLLQAKFVMSVFRRARDLNIHTALDTAGLLGSRITDDDLNYIDLFLLDIKSGIPETYKRVTGRPLQPTLDFANRLSRLGKTMWVRFVLVPDLTDAVENVEAIA